MSKHRVLAQLNKSISLTQIDRQRTTLKPTTNAQAKHHEIKKNLLLCTNQNQQNSATNNSLSVATSNTTF